MNLFRIPGRAGDVRRARFSPDEEVPERFRAVAKKITRPSSFHFLDSSRSILKARFVLKELLYEALSFPFSLLLPKKEISFRLRNVELGGGSSFSCILGEMSRLTAFSRTFFKANFFFWLVLQGSRDFHLAPA